MILGTMSIAASAYHADYLDSAITDQYNSIDKVEFELEQNTSILLDQLDVIVLVYFYFEECQGFLQKRSFFLQKRLISSVNITQAGSLDFFTEATQSHLFPSLFCFTSLTIRTFQML